MTPNATLAVRAAIGLDLADVARIYNEGIAARIATFETEPRTAADIAPWLDDTRPFLIAAHASGGVLGWVRASTYRPRDCYAGIGEFSVYVAAASRGEGVGSALMTAFIPACEQAGLWKLVSRIFPENTASRALCAGHGFREVGTYRRHAKLDGQWRDVVIVERLLPE